jgi:hypothetical protein
MLESLFVFVCFLFVFVLFCFGYRKGGVLLSYLVVVTCLDAAALCLAPWAAAR